MTYRKFNELVELLPPTIKKVFITEVKKQKNLEIKERQEYLFVCHMIDSGIAWAQTSQGYRFWQELYNKFAKEEGCELR